MEWGKKVFGELILPLEMRFVGVGEYHMCGEKENWSRIVVGGLEGEMGGSRRGELWWKVHGL